MLVHLFNHQFKMWFRENLSLNKTKTVMYTHTVRETFPNIEKQKFTTAFMHLFIFYGGRYPQLLHSMTNVHICTNVYFQLQGSNVLYFFLRGFFFL